MRKSIAPRIFLLCGIYAAAFIVISVIQFARQDGFNRRIGSLVVSGRYRFDDDAPRYADDDEPLPIENPVSVFFGGLEFRLGGGNDSLALIDDNEVRRPIIPKTMLISDRLVSFTLSEGSSLDFYVQNGGADDEIIISAHINEGGRGIELPYRLTKSASFSAKQQSRAVIAHNGHEYSFDRSILDTNRNLIGLSDKNPVITYRVRSSEGLFNPADFIISGAMGKNFFNERLYQWCAKALDVWRDGISRESPSEALVMAYVAESARLRNYESARGQIPARFIEESHTYRPSPFTGNLEEAARNLIRIESETQSAVEAALREKNGGLFRFPKLFEYVLQRSKHEFFNEAITQARSTPPNSIQLDDCAGIFEGWWAFATWRKTEENPFALLVTQARLLTGESLVKDSENSRVFLPRDGLVDVRSTIRLGMALSAYGDLSGSNEWAAVGRSLILSVLAFSNEEGALAAALRRGGEEGFAAAEDTAWIPASELYASLEVSDFYPHTVGAGSVMHGVWLWTAAPAVAASYRSSVLEFSANFPVESTHYMIIMGVKPFTRIQMRNTDYRSDTHFETYNSPGWMYLPQEQALLVKMVHAAEREQIKLFFNPQ